MSDHEGTQSSGNEEEDESQRPRPRVVDKRVSAGGTPPPREAPVAEPPPPAATEPAPPADDDPGPAAATAPSPSPQSERVWTPEQEEQARRIAEEIVGTPSLDWVVNTAVTLANVAATKLELGDPADASLAIDALAALVNGLDVKLGDTLAPLRSTLAQLQMSFARLVTSPPSQDA